MKNKIYLGFIAETEFNGCTILPEYYFETRAFSSIEKAKNFLYDWIYNILIEDEELEQLPILDKEDSHIEETLIVRNTETSYGEDFTIPCFRCWIEEKEVE